MISGVVLAAGTSTRLGRPKQLLQVDGRNLLQRAIDAFDASRVDEIVVVFGHRAAEVSAAVRFPPRARRIVNPAYRRGQSTSVRAGLDACDPGAVAAAILVGDQPSMTAGLIDRVLDAYASGRAPVVRPLFEGVPGHPVVIHRSLWDDVRRASGDEGARGVIASLPGGVDLEMGLPPLRDIDTWEDYEAAGAPTGSDSARRGRASRAGGR
jgi:molybdenum cofactor cytidylyltransferase